MKGAGRDPWLRLAAALAFLLPILVLHRTFLRPATHLVAARPDASPFDDPTTNATAMARAWARFDLGDFRAIDDRVFAPVPNAIALGEWYPLPSLIGYPFARLFRSVPLGVNVPYYLALVTFSIALYALYSRVAGPGLAALLAMLLVSWGPSRLNALGVLNTLATGLGLLALSVALDWQRTGRPGRLAVFAGLVAAQGFTSLYGTALSALFGLLAFPLLARSDLRKVGRLLALGGAALLAIVPAALYHRANFEIATTLGVVTDRATFEAHAADLLSVFHGGIYGGPVRDVLERFVPGFPLGAAAFFPTVTVILAVVAWALLAGRNRAVGEKPVLPWLLVAAAFFVAALGPVIRFAGRPLMAGPYSLAIDLPVLGSLRGIHRFDQPFDIALGAAFALALTALRRRFAGRALPLAACALVALDAWPADIPSYRFPDATPAARVLRDLGPDAIVAHYPMGRTEATQAWVDQIEHRRRVVNGWFTFEPHPHRWIADTVGSVDGVVALAILRDFGAEVVVVDPSRLDPSRRAGLAALRAPDATLRLRAVSRAGGLDFYRFDPRPPHVLSVGSLEGLTFRGREAVVGEWPGSLVLFFGPRSFDVDVVTDTSTRSDRLLVPPVQPSPFRVLLQQTVPGGAACEKGARDGSSERRVEPRGARAHRAGSGRREDGSRETERDCARMARIVIGVGNDLRGDDAAGWETVRRLAPSPSLVLHEHAGDAPGLIGLWGPADDVVVVDAVVSSAPSGTIVEIDALAAPLPADVSWATTHGAGVAEGIALARALGMLPRSLLVVGISAKQFDLGAPMTADVERAVQDVVRKLSE